MKTPSAGLSGRSASAGVLRGGHLFTPTSLPGLLLDIDPARFGLADAALIATAPDYSGHSYDATAAGAARPTFKTNILNGKPVMRFAGAQRLLTPAFASAVTQPATIFVVGNRTSIAASQVFVANRDGASFLNVYGQPAVDTINLYGGTIFVGPPLGTSAAVITALFNTTTSAIRVGGLQSASATTGTGQATGFAIGAAYDLTSPLTGDIARVLVYSGLLTFAQCAQVERYLAALYGLVAVSEHILTPSDLCDNAYNNAPISAGGVSYYYSSALARAVITTDATALSIAAYSTEFSDIPAFARLGVRVNGVDGSPIIPTADGVLNSFLTLAAGTKTVEVIASGQDAPTGTPRGTFLRSISAPASSSFALTHPTVAPRLLVYGDSITSGYAATTPALQGWTQLVRNVYPTSLMLEAYGYRALYDDANTPTLRAAFVAHLVAQNPATIWLAIGTNDYGLSNGKWSAASYGTAYAALLDDLHTALPSAVIYAQTPIVRTTETANSFGNTLGDYRTQISTAVSTRTIYTTLVDGTAFMTTASLADGIHPSTAGHVLYANAVKAVLGL